MATTKNHYSIPSLVAKEVERFFFYWRSQFWKRQQIEDYQNHRLRNIVKFAGKNVPYYRDLFQKAGVDIEKFRGLEDIEKIPLLDKEVIRTRANELIAEGALLKHHKLIKTSGSTGTPLNLIIDQNARANKSAAFVRAMFWAGYYPYKKRFLIKGLSESKATDYGYNISQNLIFLNSSRMTKDNCLKVIDLLKKHKPSFFEGYARSFIDFYNLITENGMTFPKPDAIFCYGETVTPSIRSFIEDNFQTHLFDHYGNTETTASIDQLPDNRQYLTEDFFYPEILKADNMISDTGYGELVSTGFYNYAMPLIRYKTRDYVQVNHPLPNSKYAFRQVDFIEGRMDDCLYFPNGRKEYFADGALTYAKGIIAAQYIQDELHIIQVNLVVDNLFKEEYFKTIEDNFRRIKGIGDEVQFKFAIVDSLIKRDSGKTPLIISRINNLS